MMGARVGHVDRAELLPEALELVGDERLRGDRHTELVGVREHEPFERGRVPRRPVRGWIEQGGVARGHEVALHTLLAEEVVETGASMTWCRRQRGHLDGRRRRGE